MKKEDDSGKGRSLKKYKTYAEKMLRANYTTPSIYEGLIKMRKDEGLRAMTESTMCMVVVDALKKIKAEYSKERKDVVVLHIARYNKNIEYLRNIDTFLDQDSEKYIEKKTRALHLLMDTLFAKERILGIHRKSFQLEINNDIEVEKKDDPLEKMDLDKLTFDEQVELLALIDKAKVGQSELMGIIEVDRTSQKTEDISHEEVKDDTPNIDRIKKIPSSLPLEELMRKEKEKTLFDVQKEMRQSFIKKAKQTIVQKGGHLDDKEESI